MMLNPDKYRSISGDGITRDNVDAQLDGGLMRVCVGNDKWQKMRRGGRTKKWVKSPERICIPYKHGFNGYGRIEAEDFSWQAPPILMHPIINESDTT